MATRWQSLISSIDIDRSMQSELSRRKRVFHESARGGEFEGSGKVVREGAHTRLYKKVESHQ